MGQRRRTPGRALTGSEIFVGIGGTALGQADPDHLERARDAGEQIVEVVCEPAGELADRLHLLRLAQRLLGLAQPFLLAQPIGDVVDELVGADRLAPAALRRVLKRIS